MPVATSYTETELATYMASVLSDIGTALGWAVATSPAGPGSYQFAVNETLRAYGVSTIAGATDAAKLETLATWQAWRAALSALASRYDLGTDGQSMSRSQMFDHVMSMTKAATYRASAYRTDLVVGVTQVATANDPYRAVQPDTTLT